MARTPARLAALSMTALTAAAPLHAETDAAAAQTTGRATSVAPVVVTAPRADTSVSGDCERTLANDPILRAWASIMANPDPFPRSISPNPIPSDPGASLAVPGPTIYRRTRAPRDPDLSGPPKSPPGSAMPDVRRAARPPVIRTSEGTSETRADGGPDDREKVATLCAGGRPGGLTHMPARLANRPPSALTLGFALFDDRRFEEALAQFKRAEKDTTERSGGDEATLMIGKIYLLALGDRNDPVEAVKWLKKAATGYFDPMGTMPRFDPRNPEFSTPIGEASMLLGRIYLRGAGPVEKDPAEARKWFQNAFRVGHVAAAKAVGDLFYLGVEGRPDMKAAFDWYGRGARFGHAPSQFAMARMYETGEAGKIDLKKAAAWYNEAAKIDFPPALYALGYAYDKGIGVARDPARAVSLYKTAAIKGDVGAQAAIATCFYTGDQVQKNLPQARQWFEAAARGGDAEAAFSLAAMMIRGEGGDIDRVRAWTWLHVAQIERHPRAAEALATLESKMSDEERKAAIDLVGA